MQLSCVSRIRLSRISFSKIAMALALFMAARIASADVVKIVVDDTIHPLVVERIDRALQEAESTNADALLSNCVPPAA